MAKNQYSDLVSDLLFVEYKKCSEERKQEIIEEVFQVLRSINTFPEFQLSFQEEVSSLRSMVTFNPYDIYKDGYINISSVGVSLCYRFYPNIYDVTKEGAPLSMRDVFYDDRLLKRCIRKTLEYDNSITGLLGWIRMSGCGYCNNFRPSAAKVIYETNLSKGSKVYDYAAGYGGRLLGAWASESVDEYVAVEPNTETNKNAKKFISFLDKNYPNLKRAEVHKVGSEDFTVGRIPQYKDYFDIAFSSPQYFNTEIYCKEDTQSCFRFNSYDKWIKGFLRPTIHNCIDVLKPEGIFAINIFCNLPKIRALIQYICKERGFKLYKIDKFLLQVMPGKGKDGDKRSKVGGKIEPIFYFKHEDYL